MATQAASLETSQKTTKPGRRSSRTKEQEPEQVASPEPAPASTIQEADAQQELDALDNQAEAPQRGSYLREKDGYDTLSPEQKVACDKDFQTHLDRRTRPIEVRDGETREDALLRAKHEYCAARQEHTLHHRQLAKTMLASKMNCLNDRLVCSASERQRAYRPLPVELTIGPDLARSLHGIWSTLEFHAERIERLYRQQSALRFEVMSDEWGPGLLLTLPLAEPGDSLRVLIRPKEVRYYVLRSGDLLEVHHHDEWVDRGVYLLLAELAARA